MTQSVLEDLKALEQKAEELIRDHLESGDTAPLSPEVQTFCKTRLGWNEVEIVRARRRVKEVLQHEAACLCPAESKKLSAELERAKQRLRDEAPKLQDGIRKLESELRALEQAPAKITAQLEESEVAKAKLERLLPSYANRELKKLHEENAALLAEFNELKTGVDHLKQVLSSPTNIDILQGYQFSPSRLLVDGVDAVRDLQPLLRMRENRERIEYVAGSEVAAHVVKIQEALPGLEKQLADAQEEVDLQVNEPIRKLRCMYHKG